jgi:hypothetical protein
MKLSLRVLCNSAWMKENVKGSPGLTFDMSNVRPDPERERAERVTR